MNTLKKNYIYNLAYQVLAIIVPIVTTPYVSRSLGANGIGEFSYTNSIVLYFSIFALTGTASFGQKAIAKTQSDIRSRSVLFWEIFLFRLICTVFVCAIYIVFFIFFMPQYRLLYVINLLTVFSWIVDISWFFQGIEDFKTIVIRNCIVKIIGTVLIFVFIHQPSDLWKYTLIYVATNLLGNLSMWLHFKKAIIKVPFDEIKVASQFHPIIELFLPVVAVQIYALLNKTMLGTLFNATEVGFYTQAERIIQLLQTVIASITTILLPRFASLYQESNWKQIDIYSKKTIDYIFCLSLPIISGCICIADLFVPLFFGPGYQPVASIMCVQCILLTIVSLGQFLGTYLIAVDRQRQYTIAVTVTMLCNVVLNLALIKPFGALGASIATVCSELIATTLQFWFLRYNLNYKYVLKSFIRYLIPSVIMFIAIYILRAINFEINAFSMLILCLFVGLFVYTIYLLLTKDAFIFSLLKHKK